MHHDTSSRAPYAEFLAVAAHFGPAFADRLVGMDVDQRNSLVSQECHRQLQRSIIVDRRGVVEPYRRGSIPPRATVCECTTR
jgi:hypothetical protein